MIIRTHTLTPLRTLIALFLMAMSGCMWADGNVTWTPSYTSNVIFWDPVTVGTTPAFTLTFAKEKTTDSQPRYNTGTKVNLYNHNSFTVAAPLGYMLSSIVLNFDNTPKYEFSASVGEYTKASGSGTWAGFASKVTLTNMAGLIVHVTSLTISYISLTERTSVPLGSDAIASYCSSEPAIIDDGSLSYVVTGVDENHVLIEENLVVIPANTGVLLHGTEGAHTVYTCDGLADYATAPATNWLVGVTTDTPAIVDTYVLQKNHGVVAFYHVETEGITTVTAGKVYLDPPDGTSSAKALFFTPTNETDAIIAPRGGEEVPADVYTLSGQKVTRPHRGINIVRLSDGTTVKRFQR